jgi:N-acyl homoserine lactone hydrolase
VPYQTSYHACVLNSVALAALGYTANTPDPPGGAFGRDEDGRLNGVVFEGPTFEILREDMRRMLVDTGMTELHPAVADLDPRLRPLSKQDFDIAGIDVVNTHLHFDHCGGNHLFAGRPIHVQRRELDDARSEDDYTIREWVEAPGVRYVPVDGELELLPGLRLVPAPGHTRGMQVVVVETGGRPVVVGGDVAVWFAELDEPHTEGQLRVRALDPELVWLPHEHEPWRPRAV